MIKIHKESVVEKKNSLETAVLLLIFNRPKITEEVFEEIRKVRPKKLYIAADGPRESRDGEVSLTNKSRDIVSKIDWPCDLYTLFRKKNLGCKNAVSSAISWFFQSESEGIILEDDCKPNSSFFIYCEWALKEFRNNNKVWHVNGNNFSAPSDLYDEKAYSFTSLAQVWGWATWKNRWDYYENDSVELYKESIKKWRRWELSLLARHNKINHLKQVLEGLSAWDYQWQIAILNNSGLCVSSSSNLISNLGNGPDSTHTQNDKRTNLLTTEIVLSSLKSNVNLNLNLNLNKWFEKNMGLNKLKELIKNKIKNKSTIIFKSLFLKNEKKIIIASSGRAGSTLVFDSVVESMINSRISFLSNRFTNKYIKKLVSGWTSKLILIDDEAKVVFKTHDLYSEKECLNKKVIFIYGDPLDSAKSVSLITEKYGINWFNEHQYHLGAVGDFSDLFVKDVLNYENQIKSWLRKEVKNTIFVDYDDLWDKEKEISDFLGFEFNLPEKLKRSNKSELNKYIDIKVFERLREIKSNLKRNLSINGG